MTDPTETPTAGEARAALETLQNGAGGDTSEEYARLVRYIEATGAKAGAVRPWRGVRSTYTVVELGLSQAAFDEIAGKMRAAGYDHAFGADGEIDLNGLAAVVDKEPAKPVPPTLPVPFARIFEDGYWLVDKAHQGTYDRTQLFGGVEVFTVAQLEQLLGIGEPMVDPLAKKARTPC